MACTTSAMNRSRASPSGSRASIASTPVNASSFGFEVPGPSMRPSAVRPARFAAGDVVNTDSLNAEGMSGDPRPATPELGREFAEIRVRYAVAEIRAILASLPEK